MPPLVFYRSTRARLSLIKKAVKMPQTVVILIHTRINLVNPYPSPSTHKSPWAAWRGFSFSAESIGLETRGERRGDNAKEHTNTVWESVEKREETRGCEGEINGTSSRVLLGGGWVTALSSEMTIENDFSKRRWDATVDPYGPRKNLKKKIAISNLSKTSSFSTHVAQQPVFSGEQRWNCMQS